MSGLPARAETPLAHIELQDLLDQRHNARGFSYLPRQPVSSLLSGQRASRLRGRGLNFQELRPYQPGDDVRNIDWKVMARTGKPYTRIYSEERDRSALLLVDQRMSMFFGSRRRTKSAMAAEVAAASAWRVLSVGDGPGGIVLGEKRVVQITPHRSESRLMELFHHLLAANHALKAGSTTPGNPGQLNAALKLAAASATHDHLIVLISDLAGVDDVSAKLITRLAEHNDVLVVFVYDPLEASLPDAGRLVISDGELQLPFDSSDPALRRAFTRAFEERLSRARSLLLRRQVPVLTLRTDRLGMAQVREQLGEAGHHRGPL